jgi:hypothetical protein
MSIELITKRESRLYAKMNANDLDINQLTTKVKELADLKQDYIVPASSCRIAYGLFLISDVPYKFELSKAFIQDICNILCIPKKYFDYCEEHNSELAYHNVNEWLKRNDDKYIIRTYKPKDTELGIARCCLSDSYKIMDNIDILYHTLKAFNDTPDIQVDSLTVNGHLSEDNMFLTFTNNRVEAEARNLLKDQPAGKNKIAAGIVLRNSEIGHSSLYVAPRIVEKICNNGLIVTRDQIRKFHKGSKFDMDNFEESVETRQKEMEYFMSKLKDAITTFMHQDYLNKLIDEIENSNCPIKPEAVKEYISSTFDYNKYDLEDLSSKFALGKIESIFDMVNVVTEHSQTFNPEKRFDIESKAMNLLLANN